MTTMEKTVDNLLDHFWLSEKSSKEISAEIVDLLFPGNAKDESQQYFLNGYRLSLKVILCALRVAGIPKSTVELAKLIVTPTELELLLKRMPASASREALNTWLMLFVGISRSDEERCFAISPKSLFIQLGPLASRLNASQSVALA